MPAQSRYSQVCLLTFLSIIILFFSITSLVTLQKELSHHSDIEDSQIIFTQKCLRFICKIPASFKFRKDDEWQFKHQSSYFSLGSQELVSGSRIATMQWDWLIWIMQWVLFFVKYYFRCRWVVMGWLGQFCPRITSRVLCQKAISWSPVTAPRQLWSIVQRFSLHSNTSSSLSAFDNKKCGFFNLFLKIIHS